MAMVNYGIIGLIQLELNSDSLDERSVEEAALWYDQKMEMVKKTMMDKNHDYGEAWRDMSQEGLVDLILMKLMRIRQILSNDGKTLISEGIDANFVDIINYAVFGLILIEEGKHRK
jgi:Nucleotide modification associated domain 1